MSRKRRTLRTWLLKLLAPRTTAEREQFRIAVARGRRENMRLARSAHELEKYASRKRS